MFSARVKKICETIFVKQLQSLERIKNDYDLAKQSYTDLTVLGLIASFGSKGFISWASMQKEVLDALQAVPTEEVRKRRETVCIVS